MGKGKEKETENNWKKVRKKNWNFHGYKKHILKGKKKGNLSQYRQEAVSEDIRY